MALVLSVSQARDAQRRQFGIERLEQALVDVATCDASAIRDHVMAEVRAFSPVPPEDDMTVMVVRYAGPAAAPPSPLEG